MLVNELPLPPLLIKLVDNGEWNLPEDISQFRELIGVNRPEEFTLLSFNGMVSETASAKRLAADSKLAEIYRLRSSKTIGHSTEDSTYLDVDLAVMIAVNWDEEAIFLDYRADVQNPSVVLAYWPNETLPAAHPRLQQISMSLLTK